MKPKDKAIIDDKKYENTYPREILAECFDEH